MPYPTLVASFLDAVDQRPSPRAQMYRTPEGKWEAYSSAEMLRRVAGLSKAFAKLGVRAGDRVGLFAPNCPEWHVADFAALGLGAADVPIYFNESPERLVYIWKDAEVKVVFLSGEAQARKLALCRREIPSIEAVVAVAPPPDLRGDLLDYASLISTAGEAEIAAYRRQAAEVQPGQLATMIYTSGTTGEPKGVMLTHENISSNCADTIEIFTYRTGDVALSFLPLAHVYERMTDYADIFRGVPLAYQERIEDVAQALVEVRPSIAAAVPRLFEKMYANILEKGHRETGWRRRIFDWAMRTAEDAVPWRAYGQAVPAGVRLRWWIANRLVYAKIRAGIGGRMRHFSSGGAPLAKDLAEFYWSVGVPIYQGYGLTESSPVLTTNAPGRNKVGTVGPPIPNVQIQIAEDGEILAQGPSIMQGYYRKPAETREALTEDGWLRTGDIGYLDPDGYLVITDRKKELLKTAAGKFVAPAPIENKLKTSAFIANAAVVGERRKFVSVLIVPNFANVEAKARAESRATVSPEAMCVDPWVRALVEKEVARLTAGLAQYERPKRFALLPADFTFANGELTYTLKLKRRIIEQRYRDVIEQLYADVEEPRPQHRV